MAISEEDLFYLSRPANAPYYDNAYSFYVKCINKALTKLEDTFHNFKKESCKIYIQGTYKNGTMVDDFSKLEIVVEFPQNAFGSLKRKPVLKTRTLLIGNTIMKQRIVKFKPLLPIQYIKREILETVLEESYNEGIFYNSKSITIPAYRKIPIPCEILPAYTLSEATGNEAVIIWDSEISKYVVSFPKLHCEHLKTKNKETDGRFLDIVRINRNIRDILIENEIINPAFAPSYFIECLLYNVPNNLFKGSLSSTMLKILNYLKNCNLNNFVCAHEQFQMFGNNSDAWTVYKARSFVELVINIWQEYDE